MTRSSRNALPQRFGITRVEVVVVIGIITLLCVVFLPVISQSKKAAPRMECLNNLRQVGIAHVNFAANQDGRFCTLSEEVEITNDGGLTGRMPTPWPIQLLPMLDAASLLKGMRKNAVAIPGDADDLMMALAETEKIVLLVFTCPVDPNTFGKPGGLSYVVNAGFMSRTLYHGDPNGLHSLGRLSWDGNDIPNEDEDNRVSAATGIVWRKDNSYQLSLDDITEADGMSQTLLLVENLQAGMWYDTDTAKIGFGLPIETKGDRVLFGAGKFLESSASPLNTKFPQGSLTTAEPADWRINADLKAKKGTRPRPGSRHTGGVNAMFADGSCRFLNENIDPHVYVKLLTPDGANHGEDKLIESSY